MKTIVEYINEARKKYNNHIDVKGGETIYAIVCDYDTSWKENRGKRDMKPYQFYVTDVKDSNDKKGIFAEVKENDFNIAKIYFSNASTTDNAWNGIAFAGANYYPMFCAHSLDELQELLDGEVGDDIKDKLEEIANLEQKSKEILDKITKVQKEIDELTKSSQIKRD